MALPMMAPQSADVTANYNELRQLVDSVNTLIAKHAELAQATSQAIGTLQECCAKRFSAEEDSEILNDANENMPWMKKRVDTVMQEHRLLREQIAMLKSCTTRQQPLPLGWAEFAEYFACFKRLLFKHEQTENYLWREVYMKDVGATD